jgi:hypothetical protein
MKTEFLDKRLERLEQLNTLRDLDFEEGRELAEIKRIKQLILSGVEDSCLYDEKKLFESYKAGYYKLLDERIIFTEEEIIKELKPDFGYWLKTGQL